MTIPHWVGKVVHSQSVFDLTERKNSLTVTEKQASATMSKCLMYRVRTNSDPYGITGGGLSPTPGWKSQSNRFDSDRKRDYKAITIFNMNVMRQRRYKCHPPFDIPLFVLVHNSPIHIIITLTINTDMYLNLYYAHPLIYIYIYDDPFHAILRYAFHQTPLYGICFRYLLTPQLTQTALSFQAVSIFIYQP